MHLISSQNASLWIDQMCFSVSRYMLTSSTSCIDAILCMMLFHANMEWDDNEFISTQELKKKGSRANRHLYLAICFKRQMPKIKLLQIEILVKFYSKCWSNVFATFRSLRRIFLCNLFVNIGCFSCGMVFTLKEPSYWSKKQSPVFHIFNCNRSGCLIYWIVF